MMKHVLIATVLLLPAMLLAQEPQPSAPQPPPSSQAQSVPPGIRGRRMIRTSDEGPNGPIKVIRQSDQADVLPDNYQLTLTATEKDLPTVEVSVVTASSSFNVTAGDMNLTFGGSVSPAEEPESILIRFELGWAKPMTGNNGQYVSSNARGSVRLKPGQEIQILRSGDRVVRLSIKKLEPLKAK